MDVQPTPDDESPGKARTPWHPILVSLIAWALRDSCEVRDEVSVGRLPLRLDIVLIRRLRQEIPPQAYRTLPALARRLNAHTLIEFKSPTDVLERGDWNKFLGCAHLYVAQSEPFLRADELSLIVLAPRMTQPFADELAASGRTVRSEEHGVYLIEGAAFRAYLIETDELAGTGEPVLTTVSREFLNHPELLAEGLSESNAAMLVFVWDLVDRFRKQLPHLGVDRMAYEKFEEVVERAIRKYPVEVRLAGISNEERLQGIPTAERLQGIPAEQRLQGIPAEDRIRDLTIEEKKRLRELLDEQLSK